MDAFASQAHDATCEALHLDPVGTSEHDWLAVCAAVAARPEIGPWLLSRLPCGWLDLPCPGFTTASSDWDRRCSLLTTVQHVDPHPGVPYELLEELLTDRPPVIAVRRPRLLWDVVCQYWYDTRVQDLVRREFADTLEEAWSSIRRGACFLRHEAWWSDPDIIHVLFTRHRLDMMCTFPAWVMETRKEETIDVGMAYVRGMTDGQARELSCGQVSECVQHVWASCEGKVRTLRALVASGANIELVVAYMRIRRACLKVYKRHIARKYAPGSEHFVRLIVTWAAEDLQRTTT